MRSFVCLLTVVPFIGCADPGAPHDGDPLGAESGTAALDDKADSPSSGELRVRTGSLTVWLQVRGRTDHQGPTGSRLIIEGRASRDLTEVSSWIPDDAFGEVVLTSKRKFQIVFDEPHELSTVLSGAPLYLDLTAKTGDPRRYHLRYAVEPRFADFKGSRDIFLRDAVLPIFVRDGLTNLRFRGLATVMGGAAELSAGTDDDSDPTVARVDTDRFELDWTFSNLSLAMTPTTDPVFFNARFKDDRVESKTARLIPMVAKVAITSGDPYDELVLEPTCDDTTRACIEDTNGADDLGACGTYRTVRQCLAEGPICGEDSADLELFEVPVDVAASVSAFNAACPRGGAECHLEGATLYRLPECLEALPDVGGLAAMITSMQQDGEYWPVLADGDREAALSLSPLAMAKTAAAELLTTLDLHAGSFAARHWIGELEIPCPNCHEWRTLMVIYYPEVGRVFVVTGGYFWDS